MRPNATAIAQADALRAPSRLSSRQTTRHASTHGRRTGGSSGRPACRAGRDARTRGARRRYVGYPVGCVTHRRGHRELRLSCVVGVARPRKQARAVHPTEHEDQRRLRDDPRAGGCCWCSASRVRDVHCGYVLSLHDPQCPARMYSSTPPSVTCALRLVRHRLSGRSSSAVLAKRSPSRRLFPQEEGSVPVRPARRRMIEPGVALLCGDELRLRRAALLPTETAGRFGPTVARGWGSPRGHRSLPGPPPRARAPGAAVARSGRSASS